jgi:hypothetical protein
VKDHIITEVSEALCSANGFIHQSRDTCQRCVKAVDDLMHAARALSKLPGFSELVARDKRTMRAVDRAFRHEPKIEEPTEVKE